MYISLSQKQNLFLIILFVLFSRGLRSQDCHPDWGVGAGAQQQNSQIYGIERYQGGHVIVGQFEDYNNNPRLNIAMVDETGKDMGFNLLGSFDPQINTFFDVAVLSTGELIVVGDFVLHGNQEYRGVIKIRPDGQLDESFHVLASDTSNPSNIYDVDITAVDVDNKDNIIIGGDFDFVMGSDQQNYPRNGVARIHPDGIIDESFDPQQGFEGSTQRIIYDIKLDLDENIYLAGFFDRFQGRPAESLLRIEESGILDTRFQLHDFEPNPNFQTGVLGVKCLVSPDNGVFFGGAFSAVDKESYNGIVKFLDDGSLDPQFDPGTGIDGLYVTGLEFSDDGSMLMVGGAFTSYDGRFHNNIVLIRPDGRDLGIQGGSAYNNYVWDAVAMPDGFITVGPFQQFGCKPAGGILRIVPEDAQPIDISTTYTAKPFYCEGERFTVPYTANGEFCDGNEFRVQLSEPDGSFNVNSPVIGFVQSIEQNGEIDVVIPFVPFSSNYRLRLTSTLNAGFSPSSTPFSIETANTTAIIVGDSLVCRDETSVTYSLFPDMSGADINWSVDDALGMNITSGTNGNEVVVDYSNYNGGGNVYVDVTRQCYDDLTDDHLIGVETPPNYPSSRGFVGSRTVCEGQTVTYYLDDLSGVTYYNWNVSGGSIISGQGTKTIDVIFGAPGSATITLVGENDCNEGGFPITDAISIVGEPVSAIFPATDSLKLCDADTLAIYGNAPLSGQSGVWLSIDMDNPGQTQPDTLFTDTLFAISDPGSGFGLFIWSLQEVNAGCFSNDTIFLMNSEADAGGPEYGFCSSYLPDRLSPDPLNIPFETGAWKVLQGNVEFDNINSDTASVTDGDIGENIVCWSVDNGTCVSSDTVSVFIDAEVFAGSDMNVCGDSAVLNATPVGSQNNGAWDAGNTNLWFSDINDPNATVYGLQTGPNLLVWSVTICNDQYYDTMLVNATPYINPNAQINSQQNVICEGEDFTIELEEYSSQGSPTFQWILDGIPIPGATGLTYNTNSLSPGTHEFQLELTQNYTCSLSETALSNTFEMTVQPLVNTAITIGKTPAGLICPGSPLSIEIVNMPTLSNYNLVWYVNGNPVAGFSGTSIDATNMQHGDRVYVNLRTFDNCVTSDSVVSNETAINHIQPIGNIGAVQGNFSPCMNTSETYSINPVANASSYRWYINGQLQNSSNSTSILVSNIAGVFDIYVEALHPCSQPLASNTVTVSPIDIPLGTLSYEGPSVVCEGAQDIRYEVDQLTGATYYDWTFTPGIIQSGGGTSNDITVNFSNQSGSIQVAAANDCGVSNNPLTIAIEVLPEVLPTLTIYNSASNGTTICEGDEITIDILNANDLGNSPVYQWIMNQDILPNETAPSITLYELEDNDRVELQIEVSSEICTSSPIVLSNALVFDVESVPDNAGSISGLIEVCAASEGVAYSIPVVAGANNYFWNVMGANLANGQGTNSIEVDFMTSDAQIEVTPRNTCGDGGSAVISIPVFNINTGAINGPDSVICGADAVSYSVSGNAQSAYSWSLPNGAEFVGDSTAQNITVNFAEFNGYIRVRELSDGCVGTVSELRVTQTNCDLGAFYTSSDDSVCIGDTIYFTNLSTGVTPNSTYNWALGDGAIPANSVNFDPGPVVYNTAGVKQTQLTVGESSLSDVYNAQDILVFGYPSDPVIEGADSVCANDTILFTHDRSGIPGLTKFWQAPSGAQIIDGQGTDTVYIAFGAQGGAVNLELTNQGACSSIPGILNVTVIGSPNDALSIQGLVNFCEGDTVTFTTNRVPGATNYSWSVPAGWTNLNDAVDTVLQTLVGNDEGMLAVVPENQCGEGEAFVRMVAPQVLPEAISLTIVDTAVCSEAINVAYESTVSNNADNYVWTLPDGAAIFNNADSNSVLVTFAAAEGYISVAPQSNCGLGPGDSVYVSFNPLPSFSAIDGPTGVCTQEFASYNLADLANTDSVLWEVRNDAFIDYAFYYAASIEFGSNNEWVVVTAYGECGNTSDSLAVTVSDAIDPIAQILWNGDIADDTLFLCPTAPLTLSLDYNNAGDQPVLNWLVVGTDFYIGTEDTLTLTPQEISTLPGNGIVAQVTSSLSCAVNPDAFDTIYMEFGGGLTGVQPGAISGDTALCLGVQTAQYQIPEVNGALDYVWTTSDTSIVDTIISQMYMATVYFKDTGYVDLNVYAVGECDSSLSTSLQVHVNNLAAPFELTGPEIVCSDETGVTYNLVGLGAVDSVSWQVLNAGTVDSYDLGNASISFGDTNELIVATAYSTCGSYTDSLNVTVSNDIQLTVDILWNGMVAGDTLKLCSNSNGILSTSIQGGGDSPIINWWIVDTDRLIQSGDSLILDTTMITLLNTGGIVVDVQSSLNCTAGQFAYDTLFLDIGNGGLGGINPITGADELCLNQQDMAVYQIPAVTGAVDYVWSVSDTTIVDSIVADMNTATVYFKGSGNVALSVVAVGNCDTSDASILNVTINNPVIDGIDGSAVVCYNNYIGYENYYLNTQAVNYTATWNVTGAYNYYPQNDYVEVEYEESDFVVEVSIEQNGCVSETVSLEVAVEDYFLFDLYTDKDSVCSEEIVTIYTEVYGQGMVWYKNGERIDGMDDVDYIEVTGPGVYSLFVPSLGSYGCDGQSNELLIHEKAPYDLEILVDTTKHCDSITINLNPGVNPFESYEWSIENRILQEGADTFYVATETATYNVSARDTNNCLGEGSIHLLINPSEHVQIDPVDMIANEIRVVNLEDELGADFFEEFQISYVSHDAGVLGDVEFDVANFQFEYEPLPKITGVETINYTMFSDQCGTLEGSFIIQVRPEANADTLETPPLEEIKIDIESLLENDSSDVSVEHFVVVDLGQADSVFIDTTRGLLCLFYQQSVVESLEEDIIYYQTVKDGGSSDLTPLRISFIDDGNNDFADPEDYDGWNIGELIPVNLLSPARGGVGGNGVNDYFHIIGIDEPDSLGEPYHKNTRVVVFDKLGKIVFDTEDKDGIRYSNNDESILDGVGIRFTGLDMFGGDKELPEGTYYYVINVKRADASGQENDDDKVNENSNYRTYSGFLLLKWE